MKWAYYVDCGFACWTRYTGAGIQTIRTSYNSSDALVFRCVVSMPDALPRCVHVAPSLAAAKTWFRRHL